MSYLVYGASASFVTPVCNGHMATNKGSATLKTGGGALDCSKAVLVFQVFGYLLLPSHPRCRTPTPGVLVYGKVEQTAAARA